uniref:non-specific serine/threonine protein kinase n=1 Tax=Fagus sylvatica TaxID=28930 RepID=A0A2N9F2B8_FAGSY
MAIITTTTTKMTNNFFSARYVELVTKITPFTRWSTRILPEIPVLSTKRNSRVVALYVGRCIRQELGLKALQAIKSSLIDPNGNLSNWDQGDPCTSNWTGVVCFNTTLNDGYLHVQHLDFMWNNISGIIPKEIGSITSLVLLLLNGNQLTGSLPEELGNLPNLNRIQIDQNQISGVIPTSFANLNATQHFHMNNNSISGQIPKELSILPSLVHFLLDNNNLSGYLPLEFSKLPKLRILQLDNNNFNGTTIPPSYSNMRNLLKFYHKPLMFLEALYACKMAIKESLRNCSLQGPIPDLSQIPNLYYLDLSSNQLNGTIPPNRLSGNTRAILLSNNNLIGPIPTNFSGLPHLQILSIANNSLSGSVASSIWQNRTSNEVETLTVELENNNLSDITGTTSLSPNVTVWLQGNPLCLNSSLSQFCGLENVDKNNSQSSTNTSVCLAQQCAPPYEYLYSPTSPVACFCAAPLFVGYRLKSPGFIDFRPYISTFEEYMTSGLHLFLYQLHIDSFEWEVGPRLGMNLKLFPVYAENSNNIFNMSEVHRIFGIFTSLQIPESAALQAENRTLAHSTGPCRCRNCRKVTLLTLKYVKFFNFAVSVSILHPDRPVNSARLMLANYKGLSLLGQYLSPISANAVGQASAKFEVAHGWKLSKSSIKIDGMKDFTFGEMVMATNNFNSSTEVGEGGYGKVYKGVLADGTVVAIKRAQEGSLQGETEFLTEIELLSRVHHRNLVSLIGYCDEESEQMLIYEFMSNGSLRDHLSAKSKEPLSFAMRLRMALGSAKGILYLHTEADPPIFHRDIKASNILLDSKYTPKVADFGLSRLAPVPDIEGEVPAHVSTVVKGTPGYLDPEYFLTRKLTDKSDVYSLGVVFLELLTGMQAISHGKNIVREVNAKYQSGMIFSVIDGRMGSYPSECVVKFLALALKCCQEETDARPSMAEVVRELDSIWLMMPDSDIRSADPMIANAEKEVTPPSSSSTVKHPNVSFDVSGSDLVSGVVPSITPR